MEKVIINPSYGGSNSGIIINNFIEKDYNLELSKKLQNKLTKLGIESYLVRDDDITLTNQERLDIINNLINQNDESIVITFEIINTNENGSELIYSLRNTDTLVRDISDKFEEINLEVLKYYQLRNPNNTSTDYYELIREPNNSENIIISLGNPNNLLNNIDKIANSIANAINTYLTSANIYIIKRGDTLYSIAKNFNITVDDLKRANNLSSNALIVGNELIIPKKKDETGIDEEMNMYINYKVEKGDTLYKIANKYNTSVNIIKDVNNLTTDNLTINQVLKIPTSTTSTETNYIIYNVKKGDSLYSISKKYNTTVDLIKSLNNLTTNNLSIGEVLKIPSQSGSNVNIDNYFTYTVKAKDTLYQIASKYNTSVNQIKSLNNLTTNNLSIGQILKIPR